MSRSQRNGFTVTSPAHIKFLPLLHRLSGRPMPLRQLSMSVRFSKSVGARDSVASVFFEHAEHEAVSLPKVVHTGGAGRFVLGFT